MDTNPSGELGAQGKVLITGNLEVLGNTTTVQSETLTIKDNIIYINDGETGSGVTLLGPTAGLQIDRGTEEDVLIVWDENLISKYPIEGFNLPGTFKFSDTSGNLKPISTNSINTNGGNLALISDGTGVITVTGTVNYEEQILDYTKLRDIFDIATISRFTNTVTIRVNQPHGLTTGDRVDVNCLTVPSINGLFLQITVIDDDEFSYTNVGPNFTSIPATGVVRPNAIFDDDNIPNMKAVAEYTDASLLWYVPNKIQENDTSVVVTDFDTSGVSEIVFSVDNVVKGRFNNNGLRVDNISIQNNNISNTTTNNILLDSAVSFENLAIEPSSTLGYVTVYSKDVPGTGGTGLYFVNPQGTNDELISKTKALLYSLIL